MITQTLSRFGVSPTLVAAALLAGCGMVPRDSQVLTAEVPLHLEEHVGEAVIEGSSVPDTTAEVIEWRFSVPQPGWKVLAAPRATAVDATRGDDALLLYCLDSLHQEHPDLVERYTRFLKSQYKAHRDLGKLFDPAEDSPLTPQQLETLQSLGYIQ